MSIGSDGTTTSSSPPSRAVTDGSARSLAQELGEALDELVAGVLAEVLIDDLEAVQVEEQYRDRSRPTFGQSSVEVSDQRSAVEQSVRSSCSAR